MSPDQPSRPTRPRRPGLTACNVCVGETLGESDPLPGGQRARLERLAARGIADLNLSECLDRCERGDVVVARPQRRASREAGARPVWFERLAGDELTEHLGQWLVAGGPGLAVLPAALVGHVIVPDAPRTELSG